MSEINLKILSIDHLENILSLTHGLNPNIPIDILKERQQEMFLIENYKCFGIYDNKELLGVSSGWLTVRLYSGKQLEVDNVIINQNLQSTGIGAKFMILLEDWAKSNDCETIELNTYVQNSKSHNFYFNQGYDILGFHFQKHLK